MNSPSFHHWFEILPSLYNEISCVHRAVSGSAWKVLESRICWQEWKSIRCVAQENDRLRVWLRSSLASQVWGAKTRERQEAENQMLLMGWDGRDRRPRHLERGKVKNSSLLVPLGVMSAEPLGGMYFPMLGYLRPRGGWWRQLLVTLINGSQLTRPPDTVRGGGSEEQVVGLWGDLRLSAH